MCLIWYRFNPIFFSHWFVVTLFGLFPLLIELGPVYNFIWFSPFDSFMIQIDNYHDLTHESYYVHCLSAAHNRFSLFSSSPLESECVPCLGPAHKSLNRFSCFGPAHENLSRFLCLEAGSPLHSV
ncbi:hypothetical protein NE237_029117 [Protea cynaroides]|uniref:Uncharacterized protein n=1 Tax=Protea cynaroides TaxID=273540 RepID=A0A9Q0GTQ9_9MAGN|nr:hypothetical protein NE237_029117 [Protea cynaroides]